jgi:hypothetical protein
VKLPKQKVIVGRNNRATLAAGIHEVAAQLREYSAYFEEKKYRAFVRDKYGLRIYKPKLIALVGTDLREADSLEVRRALTQYSDFRVLTFNELIRHSISRMLI